MITTWSGSLVPHDSHGLRCKGCGVLAKATAGLRYAGVVNSWNDSIVASFNSGCDKGFGGPGPEFRLNPVPTSPSIACPVESRLPPTAPHKWVAVSTGLMVRYRTGGKES
jgi:hypothetical protein